MYVHVQCMIYVHVFFFSHDCSGESSDDKKRPVIIHRAVLGSVERIIAVLTESYAGKWCVISSIALF